jgi:MFS family permease
MTGVLAMTYFQSTFHTGTTGPKVSVVFSLYTVLVSLYQFFFLQLTCTNQKINSGSMVGAPFAAIISDKLGRRKGMFIGGFVIILGAIIAASGTTVAQLVVGRFVLGFGIAIMTVAAPAYAMEVSPAQWRGRATGFYNCGWFGGSIPAALLIYGCQKIDSPWSWRIPVICQCFAACVVMICVFFIPESPRFLMANDRHEEALAFLVKYHGNGNPNDRLVLLEMEEMREGIKLDGIDKSLFDCESSLLRCFL